MVAKHLKTLIEKLMTIITSGFIDMAINQEEQVYLNQYQSYL